MASVFARVLIGRAMPGFWLTCGAMFSIVGALTLTRYAQIARRKAVAATPA